MCELATPALVLDLAAVERNVAALRDATTSLSVLAALPPPEHARIRPHAKAIKSSTLLRWLGFERVCAQTVVEAERMVGGAGCRDVLVTNQVLGANKLKRLAALASPSNGSSTVGVLVDDALHVTALEEAAEEAGVTLTVYVEVDGGQARCGVSPPSPHSSSSSSSGDSNAVVDLARQIIAAGGLEWGGIQVYHGAIQHVRSAEERRQLVLGGSYCARAMLRCGSLALHTVVACVTCGPPATCTHAAGLCAGPSDWSWHLPVPGAAMPNTSTLHLNSCSI